MSSQSLSRAHQRVQSPSFGLGGPTLWQSPPPEAKGGLWHEPIEPLSRIAEPLYRLRLSISSDGPPSAVADCPIKIFVYPTLQSLESAITELSTAFGGAFSICTVYRGGVVSGSPATELPDAVAGTGDGRTEDVMLAFEKLNPREEDWEGFLEKLGGIEKGWTLDRAEVEQ